MLRALVILLIFSVLMPATAHAQQSDLRLIETVVESQPKHIQSFDLVEFGIRIEEVPVTGTRTLQFQIARNISDEQFDALVQSVEEFILRKKGWIVSSWWYDRQVGIMCDHQPADAFLQCLKEHKQQRIDGVQVWQSEALSAAKAIILDERKPFTEGYYGADMVVLVGDFQPGVGQKSMWYCRYADLQIDKVWCEAQLLRMTPRVRLVTLCLGDDHVACDRERMKELSGSTIRTRLMSEPLEDAIYAFPSGNPTLRILVRNFDTEISSHHCLRATELIGGLEERTLKCRIPHIPTTIRFKGLFVPRLGADAWYDVQFGETEEKELVEGFAFTSAWGELAYRLFIPNVQSPNQRIESPRLPTPVR